MPPDQEPEDHSLGDGPPQDGSLRPAPGRSGPSLPGSGVGGVGVPALLALGGTANLAIYALTVLAGLLPFRPFEPIWQGTAVALCVNNGGFALMGLLLIQLAAYLDPDDADLQLRSLGIRHRAVAAALAFLLLIPLQVFASWRQVVEHDQEQARNRMAAERTFSDISRAVNSATTVPQLAGRLETLKAGRISQQDLNRPLAELQQEVMAGIRAARLQLAERINPLSSNDIWAIVQESLRRIAMALISQRSHEVELAGRCWRFAAGEPLITEYSYKYAPSAFNSLAEAAHWHRCGCWNDPHQEVSLHLLSHADLGSPPQRQP